ncbi:MAG: hypothetical protein K8H77_11815, partial [Cutibacterium acnes]|nr:hypothetical protein [Cutibacterium acnes]
MSRNPRTRSIEIRHSHLERPVGKLHFQRTGLSGFRVLLVCPVWVERITLDPLEFVAEGLLGKVQSANILSLGSRTRNVGDHDHAHGTDHGDADRGKHQSADQGAC